MVDVLVGIDYYYELVTGRIRRATGGSVAVETRLGWITNSAGRRPRCGWSHGVEEVGGCVERERRLRRVDVRLRAVSSSGQPVARCRMGAFAIPRIREKIRQGEIDLPDESHEAAVTSMKRWQWPPIGVGVRIGIDYYFGFIIGRMRRRATSGPVALEALIGWVACGNN
ncbi:hypothetical protein T07_8095 [Trichinella nelsoni]|uniref:Peptidase aspartic putative domain-containing protein n=1 Tax=Trichinella nelsoni TaxID=6336 RepID=A0A0V0RZR3_9BILA|nr:hypothetical protein T07_8095 [Trichinella nelsoni]